MAAFPSRIFLPGQPPTKPIAILRAISIRNVQISVLLVVFFCPSIGILPLSLLSAAPVHPNCSKSVDLFSSQPFGFICARFGFSLTCNPHPQQEAVFTAVGTWDIQISFFFKIPLRLCISLLPSGINCVPHHANFIQFCNAFRRKSAILLSAALVCGPLS